MIGEQEKQALAAYVEARVAPEMNSGCWLWLLSDGSHGYPQGSMPAVTGERVSLAHRMSYLARHGQIPAGYDIDHLCRNKCCVNPDHLEAVTPHANRSRQFGIKAAAETSEETGCPKGHGPYARIGGRLVCRECRRQRQKRYAEKKAA